MRARKACGDGAIKEIDENQAARRKMHVEKSGFAFGIRRAFSSVSRAAFNNNNKCYFFVERPTRARQRRRQQRQRRHRQHRQRQRQRQQQRQQQRLAPFAAAPNYKTHTDAAPGQGI